MSKKKRNQDEWTSMPIRKTTLRRLAKHGTKADKYDDIVRRLLDKLGRRRNE